MVLGAAVIGLLVGMTGAGGGALMTPMLILLFGVSPTAAISSDLVASVVMRPVGALVHGRAGTINYRLVFWILDVAGVSPGRLPRGLPAASARRREVHREHESGFDSRSAAVVRALVAHGADNGDPVLTEREREVIKLLARGLTNREIGSTLFVSESTAKFHVHNVMRKLGVRRRAEVAYAAGKHDLPANYGLARSPSRQAEN